MGLESFLPGKNQRAEQQREEALKYGYHFENLYDQNEDEAGSKINLATGNLIINDRDTRPENIKHLSEKDLTEHDPIVQELEGDIVTQYFLSQGLDKMGNKLPHDKNRAE